jgi:hypothetical protein
MKIPDKFLPDAKVMPKVLRALLERELTAGNEIVEVYHSFPAPPAGACFKMARPITTRPRESGGGIEFYNRDSSLYSGEFTDAKRFFFIVEPPNPPPSEPDMNAIRAAHAPKPRATALPSKPKRATKSSESAAAMPNLYPDPLPPLRFVEAQPDSAVCRFERSMVMDYEKWHDGVGYDLEALKEATPDEVVQIERLLVSHGIKDWRDVEALAELNSPKARALLRKALQSGDHEIAMAVISCAPDLVSDDERTKVLVAALESSRADNSLSQTLLEVEEFHPRAVVDALLRGLLKRDGETAVHFAAMLLFIHGKAKSSFEWNRRRFVLRFNTHDQNERQAAYRELCSRIGIRPKRKSRTPKG